MSYKYLNITNMSFVKEYVQKRTSKNIFLGIIYIMPQRYKKPSGSFGFLEKLYVLRYMKKLKTLSNI